MRSRHIVLGRLGFALSFEATGGETASVRRLFVQLRSPRAGGSADQVVALGDVRGPAGGLGVRHGGGREIAAELVQVAADGVPAVPLAEHLAQPVGLAQSGGGAKHVADRHRAPEHGGWVVAHRVVGEGDEVVIPGKDLRPVGLLGDCRVVVQGGDRGPSPGERSRSELLDMKSLVELRLTLGSMQKAVVAISFYPASRRTGRGAATTACTGLRSAYRREAASRSLGCRPGHP